ncbi:glycosyl transferase family 1 [Mycobacterium sp. 852014-52450_SCH5900713]|uniref:glycosyltransferase n=1 Tax=Mycobacterium sp. 852014-52450_SCH5900713 TaxID=1834116 RepID=UPI0008019713|nr:glycosyltransferase [Mycobacterium sp. 852014-52450_SCH5900713]OBF98415.1 glycosyl transferase family 1 [Mycobacterium sp. 852014-52450_SCH5900713]
MRFVLASYGSRGDIEGCVAVGRELLRRGHEARMAVPPDLVGFVEGAGLEAVGFGPDLQSFVEAQRKIWMEANFLQKLRWRESRKLYARCWRETSKILTPLTDGADLLVTGLYLEESAANIAEYHDIPLVTLHHSPVRANGQLVPILADGRPIPFVPSPLIRFSMTANEWSAYWRMSRKIDGAQRRELGLTKASGPPGRRFAERGSLEIQAYDEVCFPGLATEWAKWDGRRPFVGALMLELTTDADDEVASWIAAGTPPICFGFGSTPIGSAVDTVEMISAACAQLGERALICSGRTDFGNVPHSDHVKVVGTVNYAAVFPACRAVVHHGGAGTTSASLRAGVPTLILSTFIDQALWGAQVRRLNAGTAQRFSTTTRESLVADLRQILAPEIVARAREIATQMTKPAESIVNAANLVEKLARSGRDG